MRISLVIPIYNEEKIIRNTLEKLNNLLKREKEDWEILLVNDGSKDNTLKILKEFNHGHFKVISYKNNKGKGFAVKQGVIKATGDYICFTDSDFAYSFENLKEFLEMLKDYDAVIGSRNLSTDNHENISVLRRIFGRGFNILSRIILGYRLQDTQCGLKVFKKNVAKDIFSKQTINGWSFDVEILHIASKRNYKFKRGRAIVLKEHIGKNSKVNLLIDPLKMFFDLIKIRLNDVSGRYD